MFLFFLADVVGRTDKLWRLLLFLLVNKECERDEEVFRQSSHLGVCKAVLSADFDNKGQKGSKTLTQEWHIHSAYVQLTLSPKML